MKITEGGFRNAKKFINDAGLVEEQMTQGMVEVYPQYLRKLDCGNVVVCVHKKGGRVVLVGDGGNGHESAYGEFMGTGTLDETVAGAVLTSPIPDQIYEGIKAVATDAGVLIVVKSHTGGVMNPEMAAKMVEMEGITVKHVATNNDVVVKDSLYIIGRRGVTRIIFVHRVIGAPAEAGGTPDGVRAVTQKTINNVRTIGAVAGPCTIPIADKPGFELAKDKMEVGIGIHGESGTHQEAMKTTDETVGPLLVQTLVDLDYTDFEVAVMINGIGATPLTELFIINNRVADVLAEKGIKVYRIVVGEYMIPTKMQGSSISLLRLDNELKGLLDVSTNTPARR